MYTSAVFSRQGVPEPAGGWQWVTGEPFTYTNWKFGEPNDAFAEDTISTFIGGQWNDGNSAGVHPYLVEYDFTTPPPEIELQGLGTIIDNDPVPTCVVAPAGLVSWWPASNHAYDVIGHNHGMLVNGAKFEPGYVGRAFSFNGANNVVVPDSPSLNPTSGLTLEAWIYYTGSSGGDIGNYCFHHPY